MGVKGEYQMDQQIVADVTDANAVHQAAVMARCLKRELILMRWTQVKSPKKFDFSTLDFTTYGYEGLSGQPVRGFEVTATIHQYDHLMVKKLNTILSVVGSDSRSSRLLHLLSFPVMFVPPKYNVRECFSRGLYPVNWLPQCKESAIWTTIISRFQNTHIDLLCSYERNQIQREEMERHFFSINRLFSKFSFPYQRIEGERSGWKQHKEVEDMISYEYDILFIVGEKHRSLLDKIFGISQQRVINRSPIPVFVVAPDRNYYAVCD